MRLTEVYGGEWLVQHAHRLLHLISLIGEGVHYNAEVLWIAAWIHDWGSCPKWAQPGVNHSTRSRQVAGEYLARTGCPPEWMRLVDEAIAYHHGGAGEDASIEATLLCDADALDCLGVLGVVKQFAMLPTKVKGYYSTPQGVGLQGARDRAQIWLENYPRGLKLEKSKVLARERVARMQAILADLDRESFGYL